MRLGVALAGLDVSIRDVGGVEVDSSTRRFPGPGKDRPSHFDAPRTMVPRRRA